MIDTIRMSTEHGLHDAMLGRTPSPPISYPEESRAYYDAYWEVRVRVLYGVDVLHLN